MSLRVGTFCSGIAAPETAWAPLGFEPQWFSEIDPFASAVLAHHYPTVPNLGDMTKLNGEDLAPVDVICAGTPCQGFSVAGLRKGLDDPRSNLALDFLRLVDRARPKWLVWENVPGVLSSWSDAQTFAPSEESRRLLEADGLDPYDFVEVEQTNDFDQFTSGVRELGYFGAWGVLDAQYFGLAQRRERVFLVASARDWRRGAAVLFDRNCLSGNPAPSREAGTRVAAGAAEGADGCGEITNALDAHMGMGGPDDNAAQARNLVAANNFGERDIATALSTTNQRLDGDTETFVVTHALRADGFDASEDGTGRGTPIVPAIYPCLRGGNQYNNSDPGMEAQMLVRVVFDTTQITSASNYSNPLPGDPCHPLAAHQHPPAIAFQTRIARNGRGQPEEICPTLQGAGAGATSDMRPCVNAGMSVRRLTPVECERLMGFPDNWTFVPYRGKFSADGPRYRAIGNSMAVPVLRWIGERIKEVDALEGGAA